MSQGTGIEWTDATWNPVSGCTRVSAGCDHCYAVKATHRLEAMGRGQSSKRKAQSSHESRLEKKYGGLTVLNPRGERHFNGVVRCHEEALSIPLGWRKPRRVFVNSMSDLFHKEVPFEFVDRVFAVMALCPQHTFQVLTKRPERMAEYLNRAGFSTKLGVAARELVGRTPCWVWQAGKVEQAVDRYDDAGGMLPNAWVGASAEDQKTLDERLPHLVRCPAVVRFLSLEPLLGRVDVFGPIREMKLQDREPDPEGDGRYLHWVIVGGESGKARPCDVAWIRGIVGQCKAAGVPVFVKQLGADVRIGYYDDFRDFQEERGFQWPEPIGWKCERDGQPRMDAMCVLYLRDRKGGDMAEWPEDLRVREMPMVRTEVRA